MYTRLTAIFINLLVIVALFIPGTAQAFTPETYAGSSVLASGRWVRIAVSATGPHTITNGQLRDMGFSDPSKVAVYGYGAETISDHLSTGNYVDDLPAVPVFATAKGISFYATGPETRTVTDDGLITVTPNPYTTAAYYYLTDSREPLTLQSEGTPSSTADAAKTANAVSVHEQELVSYGSTGTQLYGEDLRVQPTRLITLPLEGLAAGTEAHMTATIATRTTGSGKIVISDDSGTLTPEGGATLPAVAENTYGSLTPVDITFTPSSAQLNLTFRFSATGLLHAANIDAVTVNYIRSLSLSSGSIAFTTRNTSLQISDAGADAIVLDVTDTRNQHRLSVAEISTGNIALTNPYTGLRNYAAWLPEAELPGIDSWERVNPQDLHSTLHASAPQMIIIHAPGLSRQAQDIAALHLRTDGITSLCIDQRKIFNEFSSGSPDPGAFRRMLKMAYDLHPDSLGYVLLLGRGFFDNRCLTTAPPFDNNYRTPVWQSRESLHENISFTTDDYLAMLDDDAGLRPQSDRMCIAVGRIPARSADEADDYIRKLTAYVTAPPEGNWRNNVIMLADDGDYGVHMTQTEQLVEKFRSSAIGSALNYDKIYLDAYPIQGGVCRQARTMLHQDLDRGAVWWNYVGHANRYYLSSQNVMTLTDIANLSNRRLPVFFGATCYFMQWDAALQSGAERMLLNPSAGVIAAISATRPVFINENAMLGCELAAQAFTTDADGNPLTIGKSLQNAKNRLASPAGVSNSNKLRYALMGDPALRPAIATQRAEITTLSGRTVHTDSTYDASARQTLKLRGRILELSGNTDTDFNGNLTLTLLDADTSQITLGRNIDGTEGRRIVFDTHGSLLTSVADSIKNGEWTTTITIPQNIADNYRPATLSLYAAANGKHATGIFRNLYITGVDEYAATDTVPPVIEQLYLNTPDFSNGATVGSSPTLFAVISDETALNLSSYGIGRTMTIRIDNDAAMNDVSQRFAPTAADDHRGTITYPLQELADGTHTLTLTIFDAAGNRTESTIEFTVDSRVGPEIIDIYTDANPATAQANFYITHNSPDANLTATICVYNLLGHMVWSTTQRVASSMTTTAPITWRLNDNAGRRVSRGIYIYRAEITHNGKRTLSNAKKLAVAAE